MTSASKQCPYELGRFVRARADLDRPVRGALAVQITLLQRPRSMAATPLETHQQRPLLLPEGCDQRNLLQSIGMQVVDIVMGTGTVQAPAPLVATEERRRRRRVPVAPWARKWQFQCAPAPAPAPVATRDENAQPTGQGPREGAGGSLPVQQQTFYLWTSRDLDAHIIAFLCRSLDECAARWSTILRNPGSVIEDVLITPQFWRFVVPERNTQSTP